MSNAEWTNLARHGRRLHNVATALTATKSVVEVAETVLGVGAGVVDATRGALAVVEGPELRIVKVMGYAPDVSARVASVALDVETPLTRAVRIRRPVVVQSGAAYRRAFPWAAEQLGFANPTGDYAAFPMIFRGRVLGALGLGFTRRTARGAFQYSLCALLAQTAAAALERALDFEEAERRRQGAEAEARARDEVLAVVAHDLRNPLNQIGASAQFLLDEEPSNEQRRRMLELCLRGVTRMNRLIGDLLDVTRYQAGRLSLSVGEATLSSILDQVDETFRFQAKERRLELRIRRPRGDDRVAVDMDRIQQALGNLVANAIKFTPPGGCVAVTASTAPGTAEIRVDDTGPGIAADQIAHLFRPFWQATADRRGLGLGLSIAKGIVEAHGGTITVTSTVGRGSSFVLSLPAAAPATTRLAA